MDINKDLEYFVTLWNEHGPKHGPEGVKHTPELWDSRAEDWAELLSGDTLFKSSLNERISKVVGYLRNRGLLGEESSVVDLGCGPGRFVAEFAKTAGHVLGVDLSDKMLAYAKDYARSIGLENTSYYACDFKEADIDKLGWAGSFDLVFTSITPAIGDIKSLKKAIKMSRAYCFNSSFIRNKDDLKDQIAKDVFSVRVDKSTWDGYWFYSLFNILLLEGYYPETFYHKQNNLENAKVNDELIRYFTRLFSKDPNGDDEGVRNKIKDYLHANAKADGTIERYTEHWYGWTLWDVRDKSDSITEDIYYE